MTGPALSAEDIQTLLRPILTRIGIRKAVIFGSLARGTQNRKSDLDLILVMDTEKRFLERYDEIAEIYRALPSMEVDVLIYTPAELERNSDRPFSAGSSRKEWSSMSAEKSRAEAALWMKTCAEDIETAKIPLEKERFAIPVSTPNRPERRP
jgi:predicted nucleotidyltransferase